MVKLLLGTGADVNIQDHNGYTPLYQEVMYSSMDKVKLLLDAGADINIQDNGGNTPLDIAKKHNIKVQLKDYAKLLEQIKLRPTKELFIKALHNGYVHLVKLLLQAGIQPNMQDLALVKQKYNQDARPIYKESYAAIGRMLLQHLLLAGELQAPEYNALVRLYHWIMSLFWPHNTNTTEHVYEPIAKSGLGLPKDIAYIIASYTH